MPVSHAFHSHHMDGMLDAFTRIIGELTFNPPTLPIVSTVTGDLIEAAALCTPHYWATQARQPVRFADGVQRLQALGVSDYLELGPDSTLSTLVHHNLTAPAATVTPLLRPGQSETHTTATALTLARLRDTDTNWNTVFAGTGAHRVDLPTYPFQHERYWLESSATASHAAHSGPSDHPLLGPAVEVAGGDEVLFTGHLSLQTHPWLAGCTLYDSVVLPASALVEAVIRAGSDVGSPVLEELTVYIQLAVPGTGEVPIQIRVGEADGAGRRPVTVHARPETGMHEWAKVATGALGDGSDVSGVPVPAPEDLAAAVEVRLPEELAADTARFGLHPMLLQDAVTVAAEALTMAGPPLAVQWRGVRLHAPGATAVRVRPTPVDANTVSLLLTDLDGSLVASVESVVLREAKPADLIGGPGPLRALHHVTWIPLAGVGQSPRPTAWVAVGRLLDEELGIPRYDDLSAVGRAVESGVSAQVILVDQEPASADTGIVDGVHQATRTGLALLREWLADDRLAGTRLVIVTRGAVATGEEDMPRLDAAALWGLLRSAQSESPGRIVLVDADTDQVAPALLSRVVASDEPQAAIRDGKPLVPRLNRVTAPADGGSTRTWQPEGTVLITGGTGALGAILARHLVLAHGARHLLLASRHGDQAHGAGRLCAELAELGATVRIAACDVADRTALQALLADVPAEHPLTGIVHAAGILDNDLLPAMTPDQLDAVLRPKADAAWHLHDLTRSDDLSAFVLFSSVVGVFGGRGQGNYAAAGAFLDGLALHRRAQGLPATSLAWGLWDIEGGINAELTEADRSRFAREGFVPVDTGEGLALFDAALEVAGPALIATPLDLAAVRAGPRIAPLLRTLVPRDGPRLAKTAADNGISLLRQLSGMPDVQQLEVVLELVRGQAAVVLGLRDPNAVDAQRTFQELGFDSLTAVELRNRLSAVSGVSLPATVVFNHPTAMALAEFLLNAVMSTEGRAQPQSPVLAELDKLETALTAVSDNDGERATITLRLQTILSRWMEAPGTPDSSDSASPLDSASTEELLDFIDNELGRAEN
ncbi:MULTISPECIES: SDR family NAD(P)-dependent oxidoreductase [unclassified Kitasatospora]|uniref:SDR family NAD(P)-dependent oxidoreductase n=2 Tax=Kitasatospora TaxID=2063 RepID=UPI0032AF968C